MLEQLQDDNPEKYMELMDLRENNPEAFREAMRALWLEHRRRHSDRFAPRNQQIIELVQNYHTSEEPSEKRQIKKEIEEQLAMAFDQQTERHARNLKAMSERLQRMSEALNEQIKQRDQLITEQLEFLINEAESD